MSHFRTIVSPVASPNKMDISDKILTIGSCFAHTIGQKLTANKLAVLSNPLGILYNPHSIHKAIRYAAFNEIPPPHTFLSQQDVFLNYDFHSAVSALQRDELQAQLKEIIGRSHYFLRTAQWLVITYGTAWVYTRNDTGEIVANCHKVPQTLFSKALLSQKKIIESFATLYQDLKAVNPALKIVLTVSPVRHTKDTLELNSVSKSILRAACYTLAEEYSGVEYFPAYEIMMDDLRDYRFYKRDMIHPTAVAEDYIWEKYADGYFSTALKDFVNQWKDIQRAMAHRPFHPTSNAHLSFLKEILRKLEDLKVFVDVDQEIASVKAQLSGRKP